jgi:TnpA family transposase
MTFGHRAAVAYREKKRLRVVQRQRLIQPEKKTAAPIAAIRERTAPQRGRDALPLTVGAGYPDPTVGT